MTNSAVPRIVGALHSGSEQTLRNVSLEFERELTEVQSIPAEYIDAMCMLLRSQELPTLSAAYELILTAVTNASKMTNGQKQAIADCIVESFHGISDFRLGFTCMDFIAREIPRADALKLFERLKSSDLSEESKEFLAYGFDVAKIDASEVASAVLSKNGERVR